MPPQPAIPGIQTLRRLPAGLFLTSLSLCAAGSLVSWWLIRTSDLSAVFFPPAGVTVALLIVTPLRRWACVFVAVAVVEIAFGIGLGGMGSVTSSWFALANVVEPVASVLVLRIVLGSSRVPDIARRTDLAAFVFSAVVVGPLFGATIGASVATMRVGLPFTSVLANWWLGDALGVLLIAPLYLAWRATADLRAPTSPLAVGLLASSGLLTVGLIGLTDMPVLFVVLVGLIVAGAQFGCRTVSMLGLLIATIVGAALAVDPGGLIVAIEPSAALTIVKLELLLFVLAAYVVAAETTEHTIAAADAASSHRSMETLQRMLLPASHLNGPNFCATGIYTAAAVETGVGGDWYDVITLPDHRVLVALGDVVGHNEIAAQTMAGLRSVLPLLSAQSVTPAQLLEKLDQYCEHFPGASHSTAWIGIFDPVASSLTYASAGHPPGILVGPGGDSGRLDGAVSPPLHVVTMKRPQRRISVESGSALVLYTDGLTERRGLPIDDGIDRLQQMAGRFLRSPERLVELMHEDSDRSDDSILLVVNLRGSKPSRSSATPSTTGSTVG